MTVTAMATFTTITPPEPVLNFRYMCGIERGPTNDAFTIRVWDPRRDHEQVSSAILKCAPSTLNEAAWAHVQELHPDRGLVLAPFEPRIEWQRLMGK